MGCINSQGFIRNHQSKIKQPNIQKVIQKTYNIVEKFPICGYIFDMIEKISYTKDNIRFIAADILQCCQNMKKIQQNSSEYKSMFYKIQLQIKNTNKNYDDVITFAKQVLNKDQIDQYQKSKIRHLIANKKIDIIQYQYQNNYIFPQKIMKTNKYDIIFQTYDYYNKNEKDNFKFFTFYQYAVTQIQKLGNKTYFKYKSLQNISTSILQLISKCLFKYSSYISNLKYDLSDEQTMKIADISREACNYYQNGVYILLVYFVKSSQKLEKQNIQCQQIQQKLKKALEKITSKYPPGQGLSTQQIHYQNLLRNLQNQSTYKKTDFSHKPIALKKQNKQKQIQDIINNFANLAKSKKQLFQNLIKQTCLQRCVKFLVGLKYNPDNPNKKALTRIKEKMFFSKNNNENRTMQGNIKDILNQEQKEYLQKIDKILSQKQVVQFKISDMVRGKCVFVEVSDIIQTVNQIKKFVENNPRYAIAQIQSRFTNKVPISDVTLKIILDNEIKAELQLTIQTNAATYFFAHKIYELERTKVFSKLKIINNYFEQSCQQFQQLLSRGMNLCSQINKNNKTILNQYFDLLQIKNQSTRQIFTNYLQNNQTFTKLKYCEQDFKSLMLSIFAIKMGQWNKQLGVKINKINKSRQLSECIKTIIITYFLETFNLAKQYQRLSNFRITIDQRNPRQKQTNKYIQLYFLQYFGIQQILKNMKNSYRFLQRAKQLQQICFQAQFSYIRKKMITFINSVIYNQKSTHHIKKLQQLFMFYINAKDQTSYLYYNWMKQLIQQNKQLDHDNKIMNQSNLLLAELLLQKNNKPMTQIKNIIEKAIQIFKQRQQYQKTILCQIFLMQCYIKIQKPLINKIIELNQKIKQKAKTLCVTIKGSNISDSKWRIVVFLLQNYKKQQDRKNILINFGLQALQFLNTYRRIQCIDALKYLKYQFIKLKINFPILQQNNKIIEIRVESLRLIDFDLFNVVKWPNLKQISVSQQKFQNQYQIIQKTNIKNLPNIKISSLQKLNLTSIQIHPKQFQYLTTMEFSNLKYINLDRQFHFLTPQYKFISNTKWKNLRTLIMSCTLLSDKGCQYISLADWPCLTILNLYNLIKQKGCKYLSQANWKKLKQLYLGCKLPYSFIQQKNSIGSKGCKHLCDADWKQLQIIDLEYNQIDDEGFNCLINNKWENIKYICIENNNLSEKMIAQLIESQNYQIFCKQ